VVDYSPLVTKKSIYYPFLEGADGMNAKNPTDRNNTPQEPYRFTKRHGSTTFHVNAYFSPSAKETAHEKIVRLIRNDVALGEYNDTASGGSVNI